jgi:RNA polymerase sigma factor (TIGR02999 family)
LEPVLGAAPGYLIKSREVGAYLRQPFHPETLRGSETSMRHERIAIESFDHVDFALECQNLSRLVPRNWLAEGTALGSAPSLVALLEAAERGSKPAADALFSALYYELRRLAKHELARHGAPMTLSATTLLHKAYIEIAEQAGASFPDRNRFMSYAARVMRGLIIDHARSRHAQKRGGQFEITSLATDIDAVNSQKLTRISEALDELGKAELTLAEVVDLKFFCGFSFQEIAVMKGVSERTVQRQWEKARIYLHRTIRADLDA